ncbi:hypothetical protein L596_002917 [Steinernema carpocapsae]|uniref:Uncharacterized protein n=1 Tax=Steinernema carpocapsae TaxID=34508 RepID=A0A4U8URI8_STECR|nr:hypothetical protein L596_002917 [Steinernema carpocapsae]
MLSRSKCDEARTDCFSMRRLVSDTVKLLKNGQIDIYAWPSSHPNQSADLINKEEQSLKTLIALQNRVFP